MKKALDYVSDYKLESACKDRLAGLQSPIWGSKIFAVLDVRDQYVVLTLCFKLVSFYRALACRPSVNVRLSVCL